MTFQCEVHYTYQDMLALTKLVAKTYRKWWSILLRVLLIVLGAFLLLTFLLSVWLLGDPVEELLVPGIVGALCLLVGLFRHRLNALQSYRMLVKGAEDGRFTLDEDGFHEETAKGHSDHPYSAFFEIMYYRERYFLFLDKRHAYVLPLRCLVEGDPAALGSFLEQKCGKPVRTVR